MTTTQPTNIPTQIPTHINTEHIYAFMLIDNNKNIICSKGLLVNFTGDGVKQNINLPIKTK